MKEHGTEIALHWTSLGTDISVMRTEDRLPYIGTDNVIYISPQNAKSLLIGLVGVLVEGKRYG